MDGASCEFACGACFAAKFGTKIRKIQRTFVLHPEHIVEVVHFGNQHFDAHAEDGEVAAFEGDFETRSELTGIQERICTCNERISAEIPRDLSL